MFILTKNRKQIEELEKLTTENKALCVWNGYTRKLEYSGTYILITTVKFVRCKDGEYIKRGAAG